MAVLEQPRARELTDVLEEEHEARSSLLDGEHFWHTHGNVRRDVAAERALERPESERVGEHARRELMGRKFGVERANVSRAVFDFHEEVLTVAALEAFTWESGARTSEPSSAVQRIGACELLGCSGERARRTAAAPSSPTAPNARAASAPRRAVPTHRASIDGACHAVEHGVASTAR